jgi:hypothetical protein
VTIFYSLKIRDSPNLKGQVLSFISPRNRVAQLHPQALGSLFVASYDSQGYGGAIRNRLHAGTELVAPMFFKITPLHGPQGKHGLLFF